MRKIAVIGAGLILASWILGGMIDHAVPRGLHAAGQAVPSWVAPTQAILLACGLGLIAAAGLWVATMSILVILGDLGLLALYGLILGVRQMAHWIVLRPRRFPVVTSLPHPLRAQRKARFVQENDL